jgi:formamidopyrimidine-DNA glycosylase
VPELLEIETYRVAAEAVLGRRIAAVHAPDGWYLKRGTDEAALIGALLDEEVVEATRLGKLLIERLEYSSGRFDDAWIRFSVTFAGGGSLTIFDQRRLGGVELDPDLSMLGPEASTVTVAQLRESIGTSSSSLKALLLDQQRLAGLGNLLVDETLWRARLDPVRPARSLDGAEQRRLASAIRSTVATLARRGGSHTGDLQVARQPGAVCPRCATPLQRRSVATRTTWSCPLEQR